MWYELNTGQEYIISHNNKLCKGTFLKRESWTGSRFTPPEEGRGWYYQVTMWYTIFSINGINEFFFEDDLYYDLNKIRDNANKARNQMEWRALDKILKGLVNEHFQWF
jgi:hypothetical protein